MQLACALSAELRAQPELAHCSDLGAFIVKKYAPAAERARELVPSKNKRFAEFARVVALAPRALIAEFDLDSDSEGEGGDEEGFFGEGAASSAPTTTPTTTPRGESKIVPAAGSSSGGSPRDVVPCAV